MPLPSKQLTGGSSPSVPVILRTMLNKKTQDALYLLEEVLKTETDDDLYELMNVLDMLHKKSVEIYNVRASIMDGSDYRIPKRY